jgi:hypothetical protein
MAAFTAAIVGAPDPRAFSLAALATDLDITLTRQSRMSDPYRPGHSAEMPLPYDYGAGRAALGVKNTLIYWVRWLDLPLHPAAGIADMGAMLLAARDRIRHAEHGGFCVDDVRREISNAWRSVDTPTTPAYAGPCTECAADLYHHPGAVTAACAECGHMYDCAQRREWLIEQARDHIATADEITRALPALLGPGIDPPKKATLRVWVNRGRLAVRGHLRDGTALYRVGDVADLTKWTR